MSSTDPRRLHFDSLVVDGHTDVPTRLFFRPRDLSAGIPGDGHVDLPRLQEGGVGAVVFALFVPSYLSPEAGWEHALELWRCTREHLVPGRLELAATAAAIRSARSRGVVAVVPALENGLPLLVPGVLEACVDMGVRYVTPCHFASHDWCDASTDEPRHGGLSARGADLVRDLGRRGILVDVSHVSDAAVLHVLDAAAGPVLATHSSARALCDHPRNLPDELVEEIARRGGMVMANAYPAFLDPAACAANGARFQPLVERVGELRQGGSGDFGELRRLQEQLVAEQPLPPVSIEIYVDHVMHLVELAGEEHVGIGTDFDGIPETPVGLEDVAALPNLTAALLQRGVDPAGVRRILGENFLSLLEEAEAGAR